MSTDMHALVRRRRRPWRAVASAPRTDAELLDAVARGADEAIRELYARHGQFVYAVARRCSGATAAAEITSSIFVQLWNDPASFQLDGTSLRRSLVARAVSSAAARPDEVAQPLTRLAPDERSALLLVTIGGCSYSEAATILGRSPAELATQLAQAVRRLA